MRIVRISLLAFGAFRDFHLDLAPGLTVVSGPNEAGKSTLHAATLAAIGGVRRGRGRGPELTDLRERYRPWDGDRWSVRAIVELADGVQVELTRNLNDTSRWQVTELHTGRDRSSEILFDGAPDGWRWLGLDRATYPRTAGVRQADVLAITEAPKALAEHLQRAIAAPGADATAARALLRIDEFAREHVGSLAANSQKPLRRAMLAEQVTQARLQDARRTHADYLGLGAELDALERTATERATALRTAEAALAQRRAEQERDQLDRLGALAGRHPVAPPDPGDEEPIARGAASAVDGWRHRPRGPDLTGPPASELRSRLEALPACPVGETAPAPRVRQAAEEYRAAVRGRELHERRRPAPPPSPASGQPPDVLNLLAHELDAGPPAASGGWVGRAAPVLALAAVIAILGFAVIAVTRNPIWLVAAIAIAGVLAAYGWVHGHATGDRELVAARVRDAERRAQSVGLPADPGRLRALATEAVAADRARGAVRAWELARDEHEAAITGAEARLRELLGAHGATDLPSYEAACEARRRQQLAAAGRDALGAELRARERDEMAAAGAARARAGAGAALLTAAAGCGVRGPEPGPPAPTAGAGLGIAPSVLTEQEADLLAASLQAWLAERDGRLRERQQAHDEWHDLQTLLRAGTQEQREQRLLTASREAQALGGGLDPAAVAAARQRPDLEGQLRHLRASAADAASQADHARGRLAEHPAHTCSVPEAEEAQRRAEQEVIRVKALDRALQLTKTFLEAAQDRVHRDIAPVLVHTLQRWLPAVTSGRYVDATVDPATLEVRVCGAERAWRDAATLSRGTQEQIYLLLRIAIVEHLTGRGERAPLLLDEVTVHSDEERTASLLGLLHQLAADRQIVLFTQERPVAAWAREHLTAPRDLAVELRAPLPPA